METGDILLFHHTNTFISILDTLLSMFSNIIDICTWSKYSHAAIIVKDPTFTKEPLKGLYVLESSYEEFPDIENNKYKLGVELEKYEDVIAKWNGSIYWRKLNCTRDVIFYNRLKEAHTIIHNCPYDIVPIDWIKAGLDINLGNTQKKKTFWCSALCAFIYTCWGFLDKCTPWTIITPKQFGTENQFKPLNFINCSLGNEQRIK